METILHAASLRLTKQVLLGTAFVAAVAQMMLHPTEINIKANLLALAPFVCASLIIFNSGKQYLGKAMAGCLVFLMISANSIAPILGTLLEGNPLSGNLSEPLDTFFHRAVFAAALLLAYALSTTVLLQPVRALTSEVGNKLETNAWLTQQQVLMIGAIGMAAALAKFFPLPGIMLKILDGIKFFALAPYILLLPPFTRNPNHANLRSKILMLYVVQGGMTLASNSRMGLIGPFATIGAAWTLLLILGIVTVDLKFFKRSALYFFFGILALGQLKDLSTAILIERAYRETRNTTAQLNATWDTFWNKSALKAHREYVADVAQSETGYNENYVVNPFISRFIQIKFDDNCLVRVMEFGDVETSILRETTQDQLLAMCPQPILDTLGLDVDKQYVNKFSIGDLIESLGGNRSILGARVTGSIPIHAFALFGWWYPAVLAVLFAFLFASLSGLLTGDRDLHSGLSTLALFGSFNIFTAISLDSVSAMVSFTTRGTLEMAIIFSACAWCIKGSGKRRLISRRAAGASQLPQIPSNIE